MRLFQFSAVLFVIYAEAYRPVVILHGVMTGNHSMVPFAEKIMAAHPGTQVYIPDLYTGVSSLRPLWQQIEEFAEYVTAIAEKHPEGIHFIGYSQGGLIARGIIELYQQINVKKFISLSSPQGGQYGTKFLHTYFPNLTLRHAYRLFYSRLGQRTSIGNFWKDPYHMGSYLRNSKFLPYLNNEIESDDSDEYKSGMTRLEKLVLIGGPDDGVITPWQSSQFGYFNRYGKVVKLKDQPMYKDDKLGLKTLDETGRLRIVELAGVRHHKWHRNATVIENYVFPELD